MRKNFRLDNHVNVCYDRQQKGYPMKNKNKLSDIWAVYLVIALLTIIMVVGVANATPPPTSRITAEPEFLEDNEKDDVQTMKPLETLRSL